MTVPATANTELLGARCAHCHRVSLWRGESCVFPLASVSEPAHKAMPAPVREVFEEARLVFAHSPRAAAALLRLALEIMLEPFNLEGKDLFEKIGHLGRRVSDETVKMAADVVRVLGNKGIHPGEIDLTERADSAKSLFLVVNMLVQNLIAGPAAIKALHGSLPKGALESIDIRDKKLSVESDD